MSDGTGTTAYSYSPSTGILKSVTYPDGKSVQYAYDEAGNRIQMADPFGGNVFYQYTARNQLWKVGETLQDADAEYSYYKNGLLKTVKLGTQLTGSYTYNPEMRLSELDYRKADGTLLRSFFYEHDLNGNVTSRSAAAGSYTYSYDKLNRIETTTEFGAAYGYDARGN